MGHSTPRWQLPRRLRLLTVSRVVDADDTVDAGRDVDTSGLTGRCVVWSVRRLPGLVHRAFRTRVALSILSIPVRSSDRILCFSSFNVHNTDRYSYRVTEKTCRKVLHSTGVESSVLRASDAPHKRLAAQYLPRQPSALASAPPTIIRAPRGPTARASRRIAHRSSRITR